MKTLSKEDHSPGKHRRVRKMILTINFPAYDPENPGLRETEVDDPGPSGGKNRNKSRVALFNEMRVHSPLVLRLVIKK